jgi:hypothetical protein
MSTQTIDPPRGPLDIAPRTFSVGETFYPDYLDPHHPPGHEYGVIEIYKPPSHALGGKWYAEVRDEYGVAPETIISTQDYFKVSFHLWLSGDLWRCICGDWCFDLCCRPCGHGETVVLSDIPELAPQLMVLDWKGCMKDALHFWVTLTCPPGTIPAGRKNTLYDVKATFQMLDPCKEPTAVVGYQDLGQFQFYNPH